MKDDGSEQEKDRTGGNEAKKECVDQKVNESTNQDKDVTSKEGKEKNDSSSDKEERCQGAGDDEEVKEQSNPTRSRGTVRWEEEQYGISTEKQRFGREDVHARTISTQRQKGADAENLNDSMAEHKRQGKGKFGVAPVDNNHVRFISAKHSKKEDPSTSTTTSSEEEDGSGGGGSSPTALYDPAVQPTVLTFDQAALRLPGSYRCRQGGVQRLLPSKARMVSNADWQVASACEYDPEDDGLELIDVGEHDPPRDLVVTVTEGVLVPDAEIFEGTVDTSRRRKIIRLGGLLLVIVVVVIVSVAVGVTMSSRRGPEPDPPTSPPTLAPTFAPEPITREMVDQFLQDPRLSNATVTAMSVNGTPQFNAFQWLTTNHSDIPDDSTTVLRMVQQFALATLYFATTASGGTNGSGWTNSSGWLEDPNECNWVGCNCNQTENETWVLRSLELSEKGLAASALPAEIGLLDSLTSLDLAQNSFLGSIPSDLGRLTSLKSLALNNANFTGRIPTQIYELTDLTIMDLDYNQLTGTVSSQVGRLTKLTELNIWTNEGLTGSLPTELGLLTGLTQVYMLSSRFSGPRLSGPIPSELGNLGQLTNLILSGYQFSRTIPTELSRLTLLDWLHLQRNELTGPIPSELGRLTKLGELDVSSNTELTGSVPESLCRLIGSNNLVVKVSCDVTNCTASCGCTCV